MDVNFKYEKHLSTYIGHTVVDRRAITKIRLFHSHYVYSLSTAWSDSQFQS